jgi:hypothetical protein
MKDNSTPRIDIQVHSWTCKICGKVEEAIFYHGGLEIDPVEVKGRKVFDLLSAPDVHSYWLCCPPLFEKIQDCLEAEADLVDRLAENGTKRIKVTIIGPCRAAKTIPGHYFCFGDEMDWPPAKDEKGLVVVHDAIPRRKDPIEQPPPPEATKPSSENDAAF